MRVFIGMETSGQIRRRFAALGHDVISCDLLPADDAEVLQIMGLDESRRRIRNDPLHVVGDVFDTLDALKAGGWWPDLAVFHPDCTFLTVSAAWAYKDPDFERYPGVGYHQRVKPGTLTGAARRDAQAMAIKDWEKIDELPIVRKVAENPAAGALSKAFRKPDQIVQPWQCGDDASKATGLWLWGVDPIPLDESKFVSPRMVDGSPRWSNQTDEGQNRLTPSADRWKDRSRTYDGVADWLVSALG